MCFSSRLRWARLCVQVPECRSSLATGGLTAGLSEAEEGGGVGKATDISHSEGDYQLSSSGLELTRSGTRQSRCWNPPDPPRSEPPRPPHSGFLLQLRQFGRGTAGSCLSPQTIDNGGS
ncbi:hypothetical protein SKAU_G00287010 [Synaphobranchus kaupii]|uniref:Uncharacterized protein n=1 Tax=Synaphobranchus kaupii TaxID=118154 RepID=A0A9Q1EYA5_SYNKA|nr:hypothetical protein SKAU_G00287010 [Synaphobranchus kaupii]